MEKSIFTDEEIKVILVNLAKFHANSLKSECKIKDKLLNNQKLASMELLKASLDTNLDVKSTKMEILNKIEDALTKFENLSKYSVCHGKLEAVNISFDSSRKNCKFLNDLNLNLPVMFDVVTFLAEINVDNLFDFESRVRFYLKELQEFSSELVVLSQELIKNSYQIMVLFSVLNKLTNSSKSNIKLIDRLIEVFLMNPVVLDNCIEVMKKILGGSDFSITHYQQSNFIERGGFLGEHSILKINTNNSSKDYTFFVKSPPLTRSQRDFLHDINGIFKENQLYRKYLGLLKQQKINLLDDCIPICYFSSTEMLILQDLISEGYTSFDCRSSLNLEFTKAALTSLAKFHASGLVLEEVISRQLQKKYRLINDFQRELQEGFYSGKGTPYLVFKTCKRSIHALFELIGNVVINGKSGVELFQESIDKQLIFARPSSKYRNTICHGDLWSKNLMFKSDQQRVHCVIVDYQTYRYSPPGQDVMAFLYLTSDQNYRRQHLEELLEFYYNELKQNLDDYNCGDIISREEFKNSCNYYKQFAITQRISHLQIVAMSKDVIDDVFKDPEHISKIILDERYDFIKSVCERDQVYKDLNCDALHELVDFFKTQL